MTIIIDGKHISEEIYNILRPRIKKLKDVNITPGLGVIIVGNKIESKTYVNMKKKHCDSLGIKVVKDTLKDNKK